MGYLHYVFHCRGPQCSEPIALRAEMLGPPFAIPDFPSKDLRAVALVCPRCRRVRTYSADKDLAAFDPTVKEVWLDQSPSQVFAGWQKCEEDTCTALLPLVSLRNIPIDDVQKRIELATWTWADVRCANAHPVPKPAILSR